MQNVYAFVQSPADLNTLQNSQAFKLMQFLNDGGTLNKYPEKNLSIFNEINRPEAFNGGLYKLMGWVFDFRPFMKKYLVKFRDYGWQEINSFSIGFMRKNASNPSHIIKVIDMSSMTSVYFDDYDCE